MNLISIATLTTNKKLTPTESYLLNFINTNPDFFCNQTILKIADFANVSTASITRFTKKLGFSDLKHLQLEILYKKSLIKEKYEIVETNDLKSTLKNIKTYHLYSIDETFNSLDLNQLEQLVNSLLASNRIILYGVGTSFTVAKELSLNLEKIGFDIVCHQDFHQQLLNLPSLTVNDHILLFSKTGQTKEIQYFIQEAYRLQIPVSIITSNIDLPQKEKIAHLLSFVTHEQEQRISAISSKVAQFLVADFLFVQIYNQSDNQIRVQQGTKLITKWNKI